VDTIELRQHTEPWVATIAGLGSVQVHADGTVDVAVTPDPDEPDSLREAALHHGWGEPLALVRQGFRLLRGTALVTPDRPGCLVLTGLATNTDMVIAHLLAAGWRPLADGVIPVATDRDGAIGDRGVVEALPRTAPLLLARRWARKAGLDATPVRNDTDTVAVNVDAVTAPQPVVAVAQVRAHRPNDDTVRGLTGFETFEQAAATLIANPALHPTATTPAIEFTNHSRLAAVAHAEIAIGLDTLAADLEAIANWWEGLVQP